MTLKPKDVLYVDGIIIDGMNIVHKLPQGEPAFRRLITLHQDLCQLTRLSEKNIKIVLDANGPFLMSLHQSRMPGLPKWKADRNDQEVYEKWSGEGDLEEKILLVAANEPADTVISEFVSRATGAGGRWLVLSNDRFLPSQEMIRRSVRRLIREGKMPVPESKGEEEAVIDDNVKKQMRMHQRLARYLDNTNNPRRLVYELGEVKYGSCVVGRDCLIKARKSAGKSG